MKSLYITSVSSFSGKTAVCLALGKQFQADGKKVGYLKPLSLQPWLTKGHIADEDACVAAHHVTEVALRPGDLVEVFDHDIPCVPNGRVKRIARPDKIVNCGIRNRLEIQVKGICLK